ncbi:hypothetical protein [Kitasatospora sp. NPDC002965]|uniref:hypothetical protein n=1 Tax=Kitasatospora sp. NPDC002965 TaxID=3154775 RepID=UPI0033A433C7
MTYESAHDLPSFVELRQQLALCRVLPQQGRDVKAMQRQVREIADTVDRFYALLGVRNWVFHDMMLVQAVATILDSAQDAECAEAMLIDYHNDRDRLFFMVNSLRKLPAMRKRFGLIDKAKEDYFAGRYYSCVLVLLAAMDGFVNEFETVRRGLHTRQPEEMDAWDSVVGHHMGLANAHKTFTKGRSATNEEPVYELYRNGIVHGSILDFDNIIVATKAWNRLFAVADWARARERENLKGQVTPPTWSSVLRDLAGVAARSAEQAKIDRVAKQWNARLLLPADPDFAAHPVNERAHRLLTFWTRRNYGGISQLVTRGVRAKHANAAPLRVRHSYEGFALTSFEILRIEHGMAAALTLRVALRFASHELAEADLRWIREDETGYPVPDPWEGEWLLCNWEPTAFLASQNQYRHSRSG